MQYHILMSFIEKITKTMSYYISYIQNVEYYTAPVKEEI